MNSPAAYAIIQTGSKQYRVEVGDIIDVEKLSFEEGKAIEFTDILMMFDGNALKIGAPSLGKVIVRAEPLGDVKGDKVIAYKYKKRKNYHRTVGHRQNYTRIKITEFVA